MSTYWRVALEGFRPESNKLQAIRRHTSALERIFFFCFASELLIKLPPNFTDPVFTNRSYIRYLETRGIVVLVQTSQYEMYVLTFSVSALAEVNIQEIEIVFYGTIEYSYLTCTILSFPRSTPPSSNETPIKRLLRSQLKKAY